MKLDKPYSLFANWMFEALIKRGVSLKKIAEIRSISEKKLKKQISHIDFNQYLLILNWAVEYCDEPVLGLHIGAKTLPEQYGILGYLLQHSVTLEELCNILSRYISLLSPEVAITFTQQHTTAKLIYSINIPIHQNSRQDIDHTLAAIVTFFRSQLGKNWRPITVSFDYPEPEQKELYIDFFGCLVKFDQPESVIEFENSALATRLSNSDPFLLRVLLQQAEQILSGLAKNQTIVNKTKLFIISELHTGELNSDSVAKSLHMSRSSYYRRLKNENTSFRELKEKIIEQTAKQLLIETDANINEIALNLGYSEHSAFIHFFNRITGMSPSNYRQKQ